MMLCKIGQRTDYVPLLETREIHFEAKVCIPVTNNRTIMQYIRI